MVASKFGFGADFGKNERGKKLGFELGIDPNSEKKKGGN